MRKNRFTWLLILFACIWGCSPKPKPVAESPRIVNIINFVRLMEPRTKIITEDIMYETVVQQVKLLKQYRLPGTFLLQYDALITPRYQSFLKNEISSGIEVGAWWEITQPHTEAAGLEWRGRYPWDWHANVGFATGYTPEEREKLVDVYMEKFKSVFGKYPASVGSWFIDAHTLGYMYDKYGITASCNCKDQLGTDGYTLWGGYWNQAYYPSRKNAYMPAQTEAGQIPVPVFRMLGSDPIYQYDCGGPGAESQCVITLEPICREGGGNPRWVKWFFESMFDEPALTFNYVQAGQENSFTWDLNNFYWPEMKKGLEMQFPLLDSLRKQNKIRVETLETSGKWFKDHFSVTPATSLSALTDHRNEGRKTVWFNSRYYRTNLFWEGTSFRFRDIHLFDERYESDYLTKAGTSTKCVYMTLPLVDGFLWSTVDEYAGLRIVGIDATGTSKELSFGAPVVTEMPNETLRVECGTDSGEKFTMTFYETGFEIVGPKGFPWKMELKAAVGAELPFQSIDDKQIKAEFKGFAYTAECKEGTMEKTEGCVFGIIPSDNKIAMDCGKR